MSQCNQGAAVRSRQHTCHAGSERHAVWLQRCQHPPSAVKLSKPSRCTTAFTGPADIRVITCLQDVSVSVVGKYRYLMDSALKRGHLPVIVDIFLVGRTKIITLHSSIWARPRLC
jgi:hypothetical protein